MKVYYLQYARKSSESEDKQVASIEDQIHALAPLRQNLSVLESFTESMSANQPGRQEFNRMIELIKSRKDIKGIICWKPNRLFRNPVDEGQVRWLLQCGQIEEIVTPSKTYRECDSDFILAVEGAQAQRFISDLKADTKRGIESKLDKGDAPYKATVGYKNAIEKLQGERDIQPHDIFFTLMRKVFDLALTGKFSLKDLRLESESLGITTIHGKPISKSQMSRLIHDPFYTGKFVYKGNLYLGKHKPMISEAEFNLLQEIYRIDNRPRVVDTKTYSGMLKCACGSWMTGEKHSKAYKNGKIGDFYYYRCHSKSESCPRSIISLPLLEDQIQKKLSQITIKQHYIDWFIIWIGTQNADHELVRKAQEKALQRQLNDFNDRLANLTELMISPANKDRALLTDEDFRLKKQELIIKKQNIEDSITRLGEQFEQWIDLTVKTFQFSTMAKYRFENGSNDDKRTILRAFGSNLTVCGKQIDITIRTPFEKIQRAIRGISDVRTQESIDTTIQTGELLPQNINWGDRRDSNPQRPAPQAGALPLCYGHQC